MNPVVLLDEWVKLKCSSVHGVPDVALCLEHAQHCLHGRIGEVVREIVARVGPVDIAVLFAGGASSPRYFDGTLLTLGSAEAVEAARILRARAVLPIHCDGWTHYSQNRASLTRAFADAGLEQVLVNVPDGATVTL